MFLKKYRDLRRKNVKIIIACISVYALLLWIFWPSGKHRNIEETVSDNGTNYNFQTKVKKQSIERKSRSDDANQQANMGSGASSKPFWIQKYSDYNDNELVEWEPAPKIPLNSSEPGHLGAPVLTPHAFMRMASKMYTKYHVNTYASNVVPFNRTLRDFRYPTCLEKVYPSKLPQTTVIIVFCDETWSTLIRTLWSVYSKSPRALLKEIILVDDNSSFEHLGEQLDNYIKRFPVKIQILRLKERSGLTIAKQLGAELATTPTITFLDAHCECNEGWLEPLLAAISQNRQALVTPTIETLNAWTMGYSCYHGEDVVGSFDWNLVFHWLEISEQKKKRVNHDPTANLESPEFAGGIFTIDRQYFHDLGGYDRGMEFYGAENVEMSLRIWLCGGRIEVVPCSRVAHMERFIKPYNVPGGIHNAILKNTVRVVDVWFDEYKELYYGIHPEAVKHHNNVDISDRIALREQLQCKPLRWYMENIFPESVYARKYIDVGFVESIAEKGKCFDTYGEFDKPLRVYACHFDVGIRQTAIITENGEIVLQNVCITMRNMNEPLAYDECAHHWMDEPTEHQTFLYDREEQTFRYQNGTHCVTLTNKVEVTLSACDGSNEQKWRINKLVPSS